MGKTRRQTMEAQEPEAEGVEAAIAGGRWHGRAMSIVVVAEDKSLLAWRAWGGGAERGRGERRGG